MPTSKPKTRPAAHAAAVPPIKTPLRIVPVPPKAHDILQEAGRTITQRGTQRDSGQGQERSMAATVAAFNAIEGLRLTERQGWAFMQILKMVRGASTARNGLYNADDALDGAAYAALGGEAAAAAHVARQLGEGGAQ